MLIVFQNLREEITSLTRRIKDLETQNRALTTLLVHQLRGETNSSSVPKTQLSFSLDQDLISPETQPLEVDKTACTMKRYNSFNSGVLRDNNNYGEFLSISSESLSKREKREKHLSADANLTDTRLSLEDKKRHHILTKLWTELNGVEVTPQKLLDALSMVDSSLWVPPKRPISLNLQLPVFQNVKCHRRSRILLGKAHKECYTMWELFNHKICCKAKTKLYRHRFNYCSFCRICAIRKIPFSFFNSFNINLNTQQFFFFSFQTLGIRERPLKTKI